ncbi:MAG: HlyD family secretion protein [Olavius algarvensis Delta 4 endosymbiont]|nr:MAG: HlyD family secretion protein [Olavius algarvensis Delta 4 endosymbiont]
MTQERASKESCAASRELSSQARGRYGANDIKFMNSLCAAVNADTPARSKIVLYVITLVVVSMLAWASFAEIDERTRGVGRLIPSQQIQTVQNLEGGIVKDILVREGETVEKGQTLVTIDSTGAGSSFAESKTVINELKARAVRLAAEAGIRPFSTESGGDGEFFGLLLKEKRLYETNLRRKQNEMGVLQQRLKQRQIELSESRLDAQILTKSLKMISREIKLTEPLYKKRLVSELEFIQLRQKALDKQHELGSAKKNAESLVSQISEAKNQIKEVEDRLSSEAQEEYNKVMSEIDRLMQTQVAIEDRVARTNVRSPVNGTVKQLLVNTLGGVVKPGQDIMEIVPYEKVLLVEAKIKPQDRAFIYPGQKAIVKITAYDYTIYGGLDGNVSHISADTITGERQEEYYLVHIKTEKNFLGTEQTVKRIMVGMTAHAEIITGKRTVMHYLLKPTLRAKANALRER